MELEQASQYKSEFLANMSHELPNAIEQYADSVEILLVDNEKGHLDSDEVESTQVIQKVEFMIYSI